MMKLLLPQNSHWQTSLLLGLLLFAFSGFMVVKEGFNVSFALILVIALLGLEANWQAFGNVFRQREFAWLALVFCLPTLALLVSQGLRHDWLGRAYDAPIRMFFIPPILILLAESKLHFSRLLGLAAPACLMITTGCILWHPEYAAHWSGRLATSFVDPNSFGLFSLIFTGICLFSLHMTKPDNDKQAILFWNIYQGLGFLFGLGLLIGSGTRGSWLALPFLLCLWLIFNHAHCKRRMIITGVLLVLVGMLMATQFLPSLADRIASIQSEIHHWLDNSKLDSSAGIRLTMWKMTAVLFWHSPWSGYGDIGIRNVLDSAWLSPYSTAIARDTMACCGPHNEFLANLLRSGILGGLSVIGLLLYPGILFWQSAWDRNPNIQTASRLGLMYLLMASVASLSMEVFTLKYAASFYSLLMAGLFAEMIRETVPHARHAT